jgi:hypothetical protein
MPAWPMQWYGYTEIELVELLLIPMGRRENPPALSHSARKKIYASQIHRRDPQLMS